MPINVAKNSKEQLFSKHEVKTDFGNMVITATEGKSDKEEVNLSVKLGTHFCSFDIKDNGAVIQSTVKGDCSELLSALLQHLMSGASLKIK